MITDEFTQSIKFQILQHARDHIKQEYQEKLIGLPCKQCTSPLSSVKTFSDDENSVIAHLECTDCGFEDTLTISLITDGLDTGLTDVNIELRKLEEKINDINRKMNKH